MSPPPTETASAVAGSANGTNPPEPVEPSLNQIEPGLFVGNWECIKSPETLRKHNIVAVLSVMNSWKHEPTWKTDHLMTEYGLKAHLYIAANDNSAQNLVVKFKEACAFIEIWQGNSGGGAAQPQVDGNGDTNMTDAESAQVAQALGAAGSPVPAVLIHCRMGMSRSATLAAAYLMYKHKISAHTAMTRVLAARPVYRASTFLDQLFVWQEVGDYEIWEVVEFDGQPVDDNGQRVGPTLRGAGPDGQVTIMIPKQPYFDFLLRQAREQFLVTASARVYGRHTQRRHGLSRSRRS